MAKVSVSSTISAAFNFMGPGWKAAWGSLLLYGIASFAYLLWASSISSSLVGQTGAAALASGLRNLASLPLLMILYGGAGLSTYGALYRASLDQENENGPAGLQWVTGEFRILGAMLLLGLAALPVLLILGGAIGILAASVRGPAANSAALLSFMPLLMLILVPLFIWISIRLSPFLAATIDQRKIVVFGVWSLTAGNFWPIFGALLVVGLASFGVSLVGSTVAMVIRATEGAIQHPTPAQLVVPCLIQAGCIVALLPAKVGVVAAIYRSLRPGQSNVAEVFS